MLTENKILLMRIRDSTIGFSDALVYINWMVMHKNMVKNEFLFSFPSDAENFQKKYFGEAQEYFFVVWSMNRVYI